MKAYTTTKKVGILEFEPGYLHDSLMESLDRVIEFLDNSDGIIEYNQPRKDAMLSWDALHMKALENAFFVEFLKALREGLEKIKKEK